MTEIIPMIRVLSKSSLEIKPKWSDAWLLLGVSNLGLKYSEEAKKAFLKAQELGQPNAPYYIARYFPKSSPL